MSDHYDRYNGMENLLGTNLASLGTDCISREQAIDALDEIEAEVADGYGYQYAKWREYFVEMPSAQPERTCVNCGRTAGATKAIGVL